MRLLSKQTQKRLEQEKAKLVSTRKAMDAYAKEYDEDLDTEIAALDERIEHVSAVLDAIEKK